MRAKYKIFEIISIRTFWYNYFEGWIISVYGNHFSFLLFEKRSMIKETRDCLLNEFKWEANSRLTIMFSMLKTKKEVNKFKSNYKGINDILINKLELEFNEKYNF